MISEWQKCDDHGGYGFKSDCLICNGETIMSDEKLIDKILLLRNTDQPYTDKHGFVNVKEQIRDEINMVRKHDGYDDNALVNAYNEGVANGRAQTIESIVARVGQIYCETYAESRIRDQAITAIRAMYK